MDNQEIINDYCIIIKRKIADFKFESAIISADRLITNFPECEHGYYYKALSCFVLEDVESAIKNYKHAIKLSPDYARAYFNLGVCYHNMKRLDEALIYIGHALMIFLKQKDLQGRDRCLKALKSIEKDKKKAKKEDVQE